jgi:hypothetical protein
VQPRLRIASRSRRAEGRLGGRCGAFRAPLTEAVATSMLKRLRQVLMILSDFDARYSWNRQPALRQQEAV